MNSLLTFSKDVEIPPGMELSIVVDDLGPELQLKVMKGFGEIDGIVMETMKTVWLPRGFRLQIYSIYGCEVKLSYPVTHCKVQKPLQMQNRVNLSKHFNFMLNSARDHEADGPRWLVCGDSQTGKNSLCRFLINRAVDNDFTAVFADLDLQDNEITLPGCVALTSVTLPINPVSKFHTGEPYVQHYGSYSPIESPKKYDKVGKQLIDALKTLMNTSYKHRQGGSIVKTGNWVTGAGLKCIVELATHFEPDLVICLGDDVVGVYNKFRQLFDGDDTVKILHFPEVPDIERRAGNYCKNLRQLRVEQYFKGPRFYSKTHQVVMKTADLKFYQHNDEGCNAGDSGSPLPTKLVDINAIPLDTVVSIMDRPDSANSRQQTVRGWFILESKNEEEGTCTFVSRVPAENIIDCTTFMCLKI